MDERTITKKLEFTVISEMAPIPEEEKKRALPTGDHAVVDITKPIISKKHQYKILGSINVSSGEATLYKVVDENQHECLAKHYKSEIKEGERQKILDLLTNLKEGSHLMPILDYGMYYNTPFDILPFYPGRDLTTRGAIEVGFLKRKVIPDINEGLKEMHDKNFIHRDIKPENLYFDEDNDKIVIGDFGITSNIKAGATFRSTSIGRGTQGYIAPEILLNNVHKKSDYFSLGITIASLVNGRYVFEDDEQGVIYQKIINNSFSNIIEDEQLRNLVRGLTLSDVKFRFGYKEVADYCSDIRVPTIANIDPTQIVRFPRPYVFEGAEYNDLVSLGNALRDNWPRACEHLKRGFLPKFFENINADISIKMQESLENYRSIDLALCAVLFKFQLSPLINYKEYRFNDLADIKKAVFDVFPEIDPTIKELLNSGILMEAIEIILRTNNETEKLQTLKQSFDEIRKFQDKYLAYYFFTYLFIPDNTLKLSVDVRTTIDKNEQKKKKKMKGAEPPKYKEVTILSLDELVKCLEENAFDAPEIVSRLLDNRIFNAFLSSKLGLSGYLEFQKSLAEKNIFDKYVSVITLLASYTKIDLIKLFSITVEIWYCNNYTLYKYGGREGRKFKKEIKQFLNENKKIEEDNIFNYLETCRLLYKKFLELFDYSMILKLPSKIISCEKFDLYPSIDYQGNYVPYKFFLDNKYPDAVDYIPKIYSNEIERIRTLLFNSQEKAKTLSNDCNQAYNDLGYKRQEINGSKKDTSVIVFILILLLANVAYMTLVRMEIIGAFSFVLNNSNVFYAILGASAVDVILLGVTISFLSKEVKIKDKYNGIVSATTKIQESCRKNINALTGLGKIKIKKNIIKKSKLPARRKKYEIDYAGISSATTRVEKSIEDFKSMSVFTRKRLYIVFNLSLAISFAIWVLSYSTLIPIKFDKISEDSFQYLSLAVATGVGALLGFLMFILKKKKISAFRYIFSNVFMIAVSSIVFFVM